MKVNSKKALSRLSLKSLGASKKRNIITIIAIALTTLLFTTLFSVFLSLRNTFALQICKDFGDKSYAIVSINDDSQAEELKAVSGVINVGVDYLFGVTPDDLSIGYLDNQSMKNHFSDVIEGDAPSSPDEISMSRNALINYGSDLDVGDTITVDYEVLSLSGTIPVSDTFKISGILDDDSRVIAVSEGYMKDTIASLGEDPSVYMKADFDLKFRTVSGAYAVASALGINEESIVINPVFSPEMDPLGAEAYIFIAVFMLLIFFTGFLIIYNIFQITVGSRIREYGLLKTIGVTSRQIRKIVRKEALFLCLTGVPLGLVAGYLIGDSMVPFLLRQTIYKNIEHVSGANIFIFLGAALVSVLTVFISTSIPSRKASKVSPVDALRYNDAKVSRRKRTKDKAGITSMAFAGLGRNKVRTSLVVISISLAIVLFDVLCIFVNNLDLNSYLQDYSDMMDFTVATEDYFSLDFSSYLTPAEVEQFKANIDSDHYGCAYDTNGVTTFLNNNFDYIAQVVGADTELLSEANVIEGDISPMYEEGTNAIAVVACAEDSYHVGDTVTITHSDVFHYKDPTTGTVYETAYDVPEGVDFYSLEYVLDGEDTQYTICAVLDDYPSSYHPQYSFGGNSEQFLLTYDQINDLTNGDYVIMCFCADASSSQAAEEAEAYLHDLCEESDRFEYRSQATLRDDFDDLMGSIKYVGGIVCIIIGAIAVLNFINAVLTGMLSRKHEFALLKAVGMTGSQLKRMVMTEGLTYAMMSCLLSIPLTLAIGILFKRADIFWNSATVDLTIVPILMILPVLAALGILIPYIIYGKVKGTSIVNDLRVNE